MRGDDSDDGIARDEIIPIVARPPHLSVPKRRKGTESVVTPGATSRITMTFSGSAGTSLLDDMVEVEAEEG